MIKFYPCNNIDNPNIREAVSLHIEHLSYRSFITKFGFQFLLKLYKDWISDKNAILMLATEDDKLIGFILGIKDKNDLPEFCEIINKDLLLVPVVAASFKVKLA
jgi:hypothetical protein